MENEQAVRTEISRILLLHWPQRAEHTEVLGEIMEVVLQYAYEQYSRGTHNEFMT